MKDINGEERPTSLASPMDQAASISSPNRVRPMLPASFFKFPVRARLKAVQQYISSFEYKHGPQTSFNSHKARPLARIMDTAKMCSEELERHAGQAKKLWERWLLDGQRENKKVDIFPKQIGKLINNNIRRKECACNEQDLGLKMVKRQQTLGGEQASSLMAVNRRQMRTYSSKIESNPPSKSYQYMVPSIKPAPRELHVFARQCFGCQSIAQETISLSSSLLVKKSSRKMCLKFLSLELLSECCDTKRPKFSVHQPKKGRKCCSADRVLGCIHSPGFSMKVVAGKQQLQGVFGTRYS